MICKASWPDLWLPPSSAALYQCFSLLQPCQTPCCSLNIFCMLLASQSFHLQLPLPGTKFSQIFTWVGPSLHSEFCSILTALGYFPHQHWSKIDLSGFPGGAVVGNLPANAGDAGSSPGLGRSYVPRSNWAREPQLLGLRVWSLCSAAREAAMVGGPRTVMRSGPRLPQIEEALAQKRRPNTAINK